MTLNVSLNITQTQAALRRFQAKAPVAIARALNRSIASGATVMVRDTAKDLGVAQKYVRDRIKTRNATPTSKPVAQLTASAKRLPAYAFGASPDKPSPNNRRGVSWKSFGKRVRDPQAFIARMPSGHIGIFKRAPGASKRGPRPNRSQLPIRELMGPSISHVALKYQDVALARAQEQLVKNLRSELKFALSKA